MSNPFLGEIRIFPTNFAPVGWALCDGQLLVISQLPALFSLLGTQYGGNGTQTFALPNLQGNFAMSMGGGPGLTSRSMGDTGGETSVTLSVNEMPGHTHPVNSAGASGTAAPTGAIFGSIGGRGTHLRWTYHLIARGGSDEGLGGLQCGRQPAARQSTAVPGVELLHCPSGCLSFQELRVHAGAPESTGSAGCTKRRS